MSTQSPSTASWWRVPMMWLVVGGPAAVVVASFATLALAVHGGDKPLRGAAEVDDTSFKPAVAARNHAAEAATHAKRP